MSRKISDFILMSDVDGTLLTNDQIIPQRNLDAIVRFTSAGGRFALCTGRSIMYSHQVLQQLPINFPCVLLNGIMLYDLNQKKTLREEFLPQTAKGYFEEIIKAFPDAEVLIVDREYYTLVSSTENATMMRLQSHRRAVPSLDAMASEAWYKGLFNLNKDRMQELIDFLGQKDYPGVRFVNTSATMLEMLPFGVSKATGLQNLMAIEEFTSNNLVAIGDYYNDKEMIEFAGIGATLKTSPKDIQDVADFVAGTCENGAVADVIEYLERLCQG